MRLTFLAFSWLICFAHGQDGTDSTQSQSSSVQSTTTSSSTTTTTSSSITTTSTTTSSSPSTSSAPSTTPTTSPTDPPVSTPSSVSTAPISGADTSSSAPQQSSTTVVVAAPNGSSSTSSSSSATPSDSDSSGDTSISKGSIVALSVAGAIAVFGAIAFIVWKLTRKRFSEFDHDGEEIKWPELNNENHALPTRPTGRVGIDDDGYNDAGTVAPGTASIYSGAASTADASMADLHPYNDPYAVPPLPHMNPNQPYRDDPSGDYYDPYHGPVPHSLHDPAGVADGSESIPMSTYSTSSGAATASRDGMMSPPPHALPPGRQSPAPYAPYAAGRKSPGASMGYDAFQPQ